jgi:hypothetical protein
MHKGHRHAPRPGIAIDAVIVDTRKRRNFYMRKKGIAKRAAALMLVFAMILTLTPSTARGG